MKLYKTIYSYIKYILCFLSMSAALTGCSFSYSLTAQEPVENTAHLEVGRHFEVNNTNEKLILHDYKEALAGDGLYYATWHIGDAVSSTNSGGDTVDLYDAQLYLLFEEFTNAEKAQESKDSWVETAGKNYEISDEYEISCNGQDYLIITYTFKNKDNPYAYGVSAFAVHDNYAMCAELACMDNLNEDAEEILTGFLEGCSYK